MKQLFDDFRKNVDSWKVKCIFEDIDNLPWYHINEHGEVVEGSNSDYETFYKAKDIFDVLAKYGYEDYDR